MKVSLTCCFMIIFVSEGIVANSCPDNYTTKEIVKNILKSVSPDEVILILWKSENDHPTQDLTNEITRVITGRLPIRIFDINNVPEIRLPTSGKLFIYMYAAATLPSHSTVVQVIKILRNLCSTVADAKILFIMISETWQNTAEWILSEFWKGRFLDVMILESARVDLRRCESMSFVLHDFNPFTRVYTKTPYQPDVQWFPFKLANVHGYPLLFNAFVKFPDSIIVNNNRGETTFRGSDGVMFYLATRMMGATAKPCRLSNNFRYNASEYIWDVTVGNVDGLSPPMPFTSIYNFYYGTTIEWISFCFSVPRLYEMSNYFSASFCIGVIILSLFIILLFSLISFVFKFDREIFNVINIVRILLGNSLTREPKTVTQGVVFICMMLVSKIYAQIVYIQIISFGLDPHHEKHFDSLKDIKDSGLKLITSEPGIRVLSSLHEDEDDIKWIKKSIQILENGGNCFRTMAAFKNITCIMSSPIGRTFVDTERDNNNLMMKLTDICILSSPIGFAFYTHSPFVVRFNKIISWIMESGLRSKWRLDDYQSNVRNVAPVGENEITLNFARVYLLIGICCYTLCIVAFFAECIVYKREHLLRYIPSCRLLRKATRSDKRK